MLEIKQFMASVFVVGGVTVSRVGAILTGEPDGLRSRRCDSSYGSNAILLDRTLILSYRARFSIKIVIWLRSQP